MRGLRFGKFAHASDTKNGKDILQIYIQNRSLSALAWVGLGRGFSLHPVYRLSIYNLSIMTNPSNLPPMFGALTALASGTSSAPIASLSHVSGLVTLIFPILLHRASALYLAFGRPPS